MIRPRVCLKPSKGIDIKNITITSTEDLAFVVDEKRHAFLNLFKALAWIAIIGRTVQPQTALDEFASFEGISLPVRGRVALKLGMQDAFLDGANQLIFRVIEREGGNTSEELHSAKEVDLLLRSEGIDISEIQQIIREFLSNPSLAIPKD